MSRFGSEPDVKRFFSLREEVRNIENCMAWANILWVLMIPVSNDVLLMLMFIGVAILVIVGMYKLVWLEPRENARFIAYSPTIMEIMKISIIEMELGIATLQTYAKWMGIVLIAIISTGAPILVFILIGLTGAFIYKAIALTNLRPDDVK